MTPRGETAGGGQGAQSSSGARPLIVTGVAGAGKTTLGRALAEALGWPFLDADDWHTPQAKAAMAAGVALTDADRAPWLAQLNALLRRHLPCVLACSALKQAYRAQLAAGVDPAPLFVFLHADRALIAARLAGRSGHFFAPELADSQFATLEPPTDALTVGADLALDLLVAAVLSWCGQSAPG